MVIIFYDDLESNPINGGCFWLLWEFLGSLFSFCNVASEDYSRDYIDGFS